MSDDMQKANDMSEQSKTIENDAHQRTDLSRRKLAKAGLIAVPVLATLASRPALAQRNFCTISGWGSVHPSGRPEDLYCEGRSPGYWKTYWSSTTPDDWGAAGFYAGPTNILSRNKSGFLDEHDYSVPTVGELAQAVSDGLITESERDAYVNDIRKATTLDDLMGTAPGTWSPALTMEHAGLLPVEQPTVMMIFHLNEYKSGLYPGNAAFHYAAALLNAARWGHDYGYTLDEMRQLINAHHGELGFVEDINWLHHHGYEFRDGIDNPPDP